ncbi:uncharacterized protein LOC120199441 [Hibiscus syriacus]|uniref:uncharacterized protein LOC120199441 n=1 Tax=Hibiscus syriacus TaxID=106335 RepID=UPI0019210FA6|nr:uncharacterized protein LOC120199441 [Hibiscus syriacus]
MAVLDGLTTKARLLSFGLQIDGLCEFCSKVLESRDHLFFTSCLTKVVWAGVLGLCNQSIVVLDWNEEFLWACRQLKGRSLLSALLRLAWNYYITMIWRERNNRHFEGSRLLWIAWWIGLGRQFGCHLVG